MSCALRDSVLPQWSGVRVNGVRIERAAIAGEVQHHPSPTPAQAWKAAAQALVVRELLTQEARRLQITEEPLASGDGRRETAEEAAIRGLVAREVRTPKADVQSCRRYYQRHPQRFRSPDVYEVSHILFAAVESDKERHAQAHAAARAVIAELREWPERFAELAKAHSDCPSAAHDGNLGQITAGQTTPEFERALSALAEGAVTQDPVATPYGFHVIRLERKHEGRQLPFELVADRIAEYLQASVQRQAMAQYIGRLASAASIEGIVLPGIDQLRVN